MLKTFLSAFRKDVPRFILTKRIAPIYLSPFSSKQVPLDVEKPSDDQINSQDVFPAGEGYRYNLSQLKEVHKILVNQIEHMQINKAVQALKVFALHKYQDNDLYLRFERSILRHIHAISETDFVQAIKYLSYVQRETSEKFLLMAEHKTIKVLGKINSQQYVDLLKSFTRLSKGSTKFYRTMQNYMVQKIKEFTNSQVVEVSYYLIISKRLTDIQFDELIYHVYSRLHRDTSALNPDDLLKLLSLMIIQKQESQFREKNPNSNKTDPKAQIMSAIYGTPVHEKKPAVPEAAQKRHDLEKILPKATETLKVLLAEGTLSSKQIASVIEYMKILNAEIPEAFIMELVQTTNANYLTMYPAEFTRIYLLLNNIEISNEMRTQLEETYKNYFDKFFSEMNDHEIAESWSLIDYAKFSESENMLKRIEGYIRENINSLELSSLIRFTHLRIKTAHLLNPGFKEGSDDLLMNYLLPRVMLLLKRNKQAKDALLVSKWFIALKVKDEKLLVDFITILRDINVDKAIDYFYFTKFLDHIKTENQSQYDLCQSTLALLESKHQATSIQKSAA